MKCTYIHMIMKYSILYLGDSLSENHHYDLYDDTSFPFSEKLSYSFSGYKTSSVHGLK